MKTVYRLLPLLGLLLAGLSWFIIPIDPEPATAATVTGTLTILPQRERNETTSDFTALVGSSVLKAAFSIVCEGALETDVEVSQDNPQISIHSAPTHIQCGSYYFVNFEFTPTQAGLITSTVTVATDFGIFTGQILGVGVPEERHLSWNHHFPGSKVWDLEYDNQRKLLYISDRELDQLIVFSPETRSQVAAIQVGTAPRGLTITPDNQKLYVANNGETSLSIISLDSLTEVERIALPTLCPSQTEFDCPPYDLEFVDDQTMLISNSAVGFATGGPIYEFDIQTHALTARTDIGLNNVWSAFRTNQNRTIMAIILEPYLSPTPILRYDLQTGVISSAHYSIENSININKAGNRIATTQSGCYGGLVTVLDETMSILGRVSIPECASSSVAFDPVRSNYLYTIATQSPFRLNRINLDQLIHDLSITYSHAYPEHTAVIQTLTISDDGEWAYVLTLDYDTNNPISSYLQAVKLTLDLENDFQWVYLPLIKR